MPGCQRPLAGAHQNSSRLAGAFFFIPFRLDAIVNRKRASHAISALVNERCMYLDFLSVLVDSKFDMGGNSFRVRECLGKLVPIDLVSPVGRHAAQERMRV